LKTTVYTVYIIRQCSTVCRIVIKIENVWVTTSSVVLLFFVYYVVIENFREPKVIRYIFTRTMITSRGVIRCSPPLYIVGNGVHENVRICTILYSCHQLLVARHACIIPRGIRRSIYIYNSNTVQTRRVVIKRVRSKLTRRIHRTRAMSNSELVG